jgi:hypothetical protein
VREGVRRDSEMAKEMGNPWVEMGNQRKSTGKLTYLVTMQGGAP